jgi:GntR family transcriptional regulator
MLPFKVQFKPGVPAFQQVVYAATKAIVGRQLRPGDKFPSVRALSQALKINPNTAHKVVAELTRVGLLEVRLGLGTVVARIPPSSRGERTALLKDDIERLVVEAKRLSIGLEELVDTVKDHWRVLYSENRAGEELLKEKV